MSPQAPETCHCEKRSDAAIPASGSEDGDRHVATLLAMTFSSRAGRPPAGVELTRKWVRGRLESVIARSEATRQSAASSSEDGDRHVATLLAMTVSFRAGRPPAGVELATDFWGRQATENKELVPKLTFVQYGKLQIQDIDRRPSWPSIRPKSLATAQTIT
jgi:hypothetical protein